MLTWLLQNALLAVPLAGLLLVVGRYARARPAVLHALWVVVLLRLLTPAGLIWPLQVGQVGPGVWGFEPPATAPPAAPVAVRPSVPIAVAWEGTEAEHDADSSEPAALPAETTAPPAAPPSAALAPLLPCLLLLWGVGALLMAGRLTWQMARFARLLRREGTEAPPWLVTQVAELAGQLGVSVPAVRQLAGLGTPLIWCGWRAVLVWSPGLEEKLSPAGRRAVLLHELAHLRRRDHWVRRLELLAATLHWWDPLFWLVQRQLHAQAELACDAWVAEEVPTDRRAYAEAILTVCEGMARPAATAAAVGFGAVGRQELQRRLTMIMRGKVPGRLPRRGMVLAGALALAALPGWTLGQEAPPPPATPAPTVEGASDAPLYVLDVETGRPLYILNVLDDTPPSERDQKLAEIERKLQALLKELKQLRADPTAKRPGATLHAETVRVNDETVRIAHALRYLIASQQAADSRARAALALVRAEQATYRLPAAKAKPLAEFLTKYAGQTVRAVKVEGDQLTVTAAPGTQGSIAELIKAMGGK